SGRPAQQLVDRDAQLLALDVPERLLDPRDRRIQDDSAAPEPVPMEPLPVVLDRARVLADQVPRELVDGRRYRSLAPLDGRLPDAGDPFIGRDLHEVPVLPLNPHQQVVDRHDLHEPCLPGARADRPAADQGATEHGTPPPGTMPASTQGLRPYREG